MAAIDTILGVAAMVGGGYIVVAYLLPMIQAQTQTQATQSDVQSFQDWFSGTFADTSLQTEEGALSELINELGEEDLVNKLEALVNGEDEEEEDKKKKKSSDEEDEDEAMEAVFEDKKPKAATVKPKATKKLNSKAGSDKFYADAKKNKTTAAQKAAVVKMFGR